MRGREHSRVCIARLQSLVSRKLDFKTRSDIRTKVEFNGLMSNNPGV